MNSRSKQLPRPKYWQEFEDLCLVLFKAIWEDRQAQKNGRAGQPQHGVDVWGAIDGNRARFQGVQCKGKDQALGAVVTEAEFRLEIEKADKFTPALEHWALVTTAPADAGLQEVARAISVERHSTGKFTVQYLGWADLEALIADHPAVMQEFYPGFALDAHTLAHATLKVGSSVHTAGPGVVLPATNAPPWHVITFDTSRDIGPALMGRPLGPADASACPRLPEVDLAVRQLTMAFSARLVGDPGTGKSVCAYQVAYDFARRGWKVFGMRGADGPPAGLPSATSEGTVLVIDDAHLLGDGELRRLEGFATASRLVISTHNAIEGQASQRGAVRMDPKAGIRAIAAGLLQDRRATLAAVRRADCHVGEQMLDTTLEERLEHASSYAAVPWQFCFVLGGGWRRAKDAAGTAIVLGAGLPLAAIAIRQLASRDGRCSSADVDQLLSKASVDRAGLDDAISALVDERMVIGPNDLRCPHQRLAGVLLGYLLDRFDEQEIASFAKVVNTVLADRAFPLGGIATLLHEIHFSEYGRWRRLIERAALEELFARCWSASAPDEITSACFALAEAAPYWQEWPEYLTQNSERVVAWIETAVNPMGHGLARLLHSLPNQQPDVMSQVTRRASPGLISRRISVADSESIWHLAALTKCFQLGSGDPWAKELVGGLDRSRLLNLASTWPTDAPIYRLISLFEALAWGAEALTLDLVEACLPVARHLLFDDPVGQFQYLDDLAFHVLRVLDPLGVYKGKLRPAARHVRIAKGLFDGADLVDLAQKLSRAPLRSFQQLSHMLALLRRVSLPNYNKLVKLLDWDAIGSTIGEHWAHLPHDPEVLLGVASCTARSRDIVAAFVERNTGRMKTMPARLVIVAPQVAVSFVKSGRTISLASHGHVHWQYGGYVVELFASEAPELMPNILTGAMAAMAKALSSEHESWYSEAQPMLCAMLEHAPAGLHEMLSLIDPKKAAVGWQAARKAGGGSRRTVDTLVRAATDRSDALGDVARQLGRRRGRTRRPDGLVDPKGLHRRSNT
jgi:hypothetical protein